jgi:hypothetical protein
MGGPPAPVCSAVPSWVAARLPHLSKHDFPSQSKCRELPPQM